MVECENVVPSTGKRCGEDAIGPFHERFCSNECADRTNQRELAELGITPELMSKALEGYYECKDMIETRSASSDAAVEPALESPYDDLCNRSPQDHEE